MLPCHKEAKHEQYGAEGGHDCHHKGPGHGIGITYSLHHLTCGIFLADNGVLEQPEDAHCDEAADIGKEHAEGGEHGLFLGVVSHYAKHGPVWDVYCGVHRHHKDVHHVSIHVLEAVGRIRDIERQYADESKGNGHPEKIGTVFSPFCISAVSNDAHHWVRHGVVQLCHQQQRGCVHRLEAEDVRIKDWKIIGKDFPEHGRRKVSESISDFF